MKHRITLITMIILLVLSGFNLHAAAETYTEPLTGMEFVLIKGGKFVMGDISGRDKAALPAHRVAVGDFFLGRHEVTFDQYDMFCEETKKNKPDDNGWGRGNRPVININWHDADAFSKWLSKKSGKSFRLPTEAEWEYAARGGKGSRFWWGNQVGIGLANCDNCSSQWSGKTTAPVGSFKPNPFGLYDMNGNVYEWVQDSKHRNYQGAPDDGSAWISKNEKKKISRSGSWLMPAKEMTAYARSWDPANERNNTIGMRLVMEP